MGRNICSRSFIKFETVTVKNILFNSYVIKITSLGLQFGTNKKGLSRKTAWELKNNRDPGIVYKEIMHHTMTLIGGTNEPNQTLDDYAIEPFFPAFCFKYVSYCGLSLKIRIFRAMPFGESRKILP